MTSLDGDVLDDVEPAPLWCSREWPDGKCFGLGDSLGDIA